MPPVASPETICWSRASIFGRSIPQVSASDRFVFFEHSRGTRCHHPTRLQQVGGLREIEREWGILLDQKHAHPTAFVELAHHSEDLRCHQGRDAQGWLIEKQQPRPKQ